MTPSKTKQAFDDLDTLIPAEPDFRGVRPAHRMRPDEVTPTDYQRRAHLRWMCGAGKALVDEGRIEKAMRWLGFVQGALWGMGLVTIECMKLVNKPEVGDG
jgi:hypothetical protein